MERFYAGQQVSVQERDWLGKKHKVGIIVTKIFSDAKYVKHTGDIRFSSYLVWFNGKIKECKTENIRNATSMDMSVYLNTE